MHDMAFTIRLLEENFNRLGNFFGSLWARSDEMLQHLPKEIDVIKRVDRHGLDLMFIVRGLLEAREVCCKPVQLDRMLGFILLGLNGCHAFCVSKNALDFGLTKTFAMYNCIVICCDDYLSTSTVLEI